MYNELMNLSKQMRKYYSTSEVGQRHLLLNTPLTVDVFTDFNINKALIDSNEIIFVANLLFFIHLNKLEDKEFFDIVSEKSFVIYVLVDNNLLPLNTEMFSSYLEKIKFGILKLAYNFKSNLT